MTILAYILFAAIAQLSVMQLNDYIGFQRLKKQSERDRAGSFERWQKLLADRDNENALNQTERDTEFDRRIVQLEHQLTEGRFAPRGTH